MQLDKDAADRFIKAALAEDDQESTDKDSKEPEDKAQASKKRKESHEGNSGEVKSKRPKVDPFEGRVFKRLYVVCGSSDA